VTIGDDQTALFETPEVANMILISGKDSIADILCTALDSIGRAYCRVDELDSHDAWRLRATTIIAVEELPRVAAPAPATGRGLRDVISAANAPGVRDVIIVTSRPDDDAELRAVRRSGIPYTILRPSPIFEWAASPGARVLVARELSSAPASAVSSERVVEAVVGTLDGGTCGRTLDVAPPPGTTWADLLASAGAMPKPVARWRARVGRWLGARTLDVAGASATA
jgi:hypothetical protein